MFKHVLAPQPYSTPARNVDEKLLQVFGQGECKRTAVNDKRALVGRYSLFKTYVHALVGLVGQYSWFMLQSEYVRRRGLASSQEHSYWFQPGSTLGNWSPASPHTWGESGRAVVSMRLALIRMARVSGELLAFNRIWCMSCGEKKRGGG